MLKMLLVILEGIKVKLVPISVLEIVAEAAKIGIKLYTAISIPLKKLVKYIPKFIPDPTHDHNLPSVIVPPTKIPDAQMGFNCTSELFPTVKYVYYTLFITVVVPTTL